MVILFNDIETTNINIIKPIKVGDNEYFGLRYQDNSKCIPFIIQTPFLYVKYRPSVFQSGYMRLDMELCEESIDIISKIEKYIYSRLTKKFKSKLHNFSFSNNVLRVRTMNYNSIEVFDINKCNLDINKICNGDKICVILLVDKYIYNEQKSYINYNILQIQKFVVLPSLHQQSNPLHQQCNSSYEKYHKMLRLGIPKIAVRQKMQLDGLSISVIDDVLKYLLSQIYTQNTITPNTITPTTITPTTITPNTITQNTITPITPPIPPPPPPPPPLYKAFNKNIDNSMKMTALFNDINTGNFKLKKAHIVAQNEAQKQKNKILKHVDTSRKVPSLEEIQNALKNLRKIN